MSRNDLPSRSWGSEPGSVLLVCTGNQCRSPMAAAMLGRVLTERGSSIRVESAGFISDGAPCPREVGQVMANLGYDLSRHRSRTISEPMIDEADFIVGMTRQHVVDLTLRAPRSWKRTFTLGEVVRLGELFGPRRPGESLATWVGRVGSSRTKSGLLGLPLSDDVPDPIGKPLDAYVRSRDLLLHLCSRLGSLIAPV